MPRLVVICFTLALFGLQSFALAAGAPITFRELQRDIRSHRIASMESLLEFFSKTPRYESLLSTAVLEESSGAIHRDDVTPEFPRIVLHGGNLTMHLTGDVRKPGHELLEIAEYLPEQNRFAFRLVNFALAGTEIMFLEDAAKELTNLKTQDAYDKSVGAGVFTCDACHTRLHDGGALPIWDPLTSLFRPFGKGVDRIPAGTLEAAHYAQYLKTRNDPQLGKLYRWIEQKTERASNGDLVFTGEPNRKLTEHIFGQAHRRIAGKLESMPSYGRFQYAVIGLFLGCPDVRQFLPDEIRKHHEQQVIDRIDSTTVGAFYLTLGSQVRKQDILPQYQDTYDKHPDLIDGTTGYLLEGKFLRMTSLPLPQALGLALESRDQELSEQFTSQLPAELRASHVTKEAEYRTAPYLDVLRGLRYLFRADVERNIELPLAVTDELTINGGEPAASYRYLGGLEGLRSLGADYLGPHFLARHPELDAFSKRRVHRDNLKVPLNEYCERLRQRSWKALTLPLE